MKETLYILRMDDACPWMDHKSWDRLEAIFDKYNVKPVVAVVPQCEDPELKVAEEDPEFWNKVLRWQSKGWTIALHGCNHVYIGKSRGLVPLNARTEFAGVAEETQRLKIREGYRALRERGVNPSVWIAPAHTFDKTTLRVLQEETRIRVVSDGLSQRPFQRYQMTWVPQQLWWPRPVPPGVWTVCLHPSSMSPDMPGRLEAFLEKFSSQCVPLETVLENPPNWGLPDFLFEWGF
ncbi:MAG: DUF2334 domain-containing protein, partial [Spirochaetales bacterium]|nr:DUF2334 domain-containing protein [Spirochaetales bacterium]